MGGPTWRGTEWPPGCAPRRRPRAAAAAVRGAGLKALLVDTSPKPQPQARRLAQELGALYLPLPHADAAALSTAARQAAAVR
jgi:magnesium chelatase subunit D